MGDDAAIEGRAPTPAVVAQIYHSVFSDQRLFQGEFLERVIEWIPKHDSIESPREVTGVEPRLHKSVIVMTQDCDLEQDWTRRSSKLGEATDLPGILMCPAVPADEARSNQGLSSDLWKPVRSNKNERFQYLADVPRECDGTREGHPAILVDFKSLFSIRTVEIYRQLRRGTADSPRRRFRMATPWAEHMQSRFAAYHARIGLPRDHFIPESRRA